MAKKQFKTESKRLLDLMINSIYTNREIFLRELISNASDALDKRHYMALTDAKYASSDPLKIDIAVDKKARTLTVADNGIGMDKEGLEKELGTIAHSGSADFKQAMDDKKSDVDIIGQFGVGFYSSFMVASKVVVESKTVDAPANRWTSEGEDGYAIEPCDKESVGTRITLYLRPDTADVKYDDYLESYKLQELIRKYSDYIRYPIQMMVEKSKPVEGEKDKDGSQKYETTEQLETLNSMVPLWRRSKKDIKDSEYDDFYKNKFSDWEAPAKVIHYSLEGSLSYKALLFIPAKVPFNYYAQEYEPGLQLYSKGVFIMDHAKDLLPDWARFVKGLVDTEDVSLNISREILQQDKQLQQLRESITKKIKGALVDMLTKQRDKYEDFFKNFGLGLKFSIYNSYGMNKDELQDLLLFYSSHDGKYVTLKEYTDRLKPEQKDIYYCTGKSIEQIKQLPQIDKMLAKGYEVLYLTDDVDEFALSIMHDYGSHEFKSIQNADVDLEDEAEKKAKEETAKANESLLAKMKEALAGKVKDVRISSRLTTHPVCLVADKGVSLEMQKVLNKTPEGKDVKAEKILEINPGHEVFGALQKAFASDPSSIGRYSDLLYQQAMLIEGFSIDDPVAYANEICDLMVAASGHGQGVDHGKDAPAAVEPEPAAPKAEKPEPAAEKKDNTGAADAK